MKARAWLEKPLTGIEEGGRIPETELYIVADEQGRDHLVWFVRTGVIPGMGPWRVFVDAHTGEVIQGERDAVSYTDGAGTVFNPDPITTLQDPSLTDQNDTDYAALQGAYKGIVLRDLDPPSNGAYHIQGRYSQSANLGAHAGQDPGFDPVSSSDTLFYFNRSEPGFEEVNAYYHIHAYARYIVFLDASYAVKFQNRVVFDAHNSDQWDTWYSTGQGTIVFGDNDSPSPNVDTAEDPGVVIHEFGHYITDKFNANYIYLVNSGDIPRLREGYSMYMEVSARRATPEGSGYEIDIISPWSYSPNTPFSLSEGLQYPDDNKDDDVTGAPHYPGGLLWASTLMDVEEAVGDRDIATVLLLESVATLTTSSTMKDAALAILDADVGMFGGAHEGAIAGALAKRGFLETVGGVAGDDQTWAGYCYVIDDVYFESGTTLTILPGATVTLCSVPEGLNLGLDPTRTEILVDGVVIINGTAESGVRFLQDTVAPAPDDNQGLVIGSGSGISAAANISYATFVGSSCAIYAAGEAEVTLDHLTVSGSNIGVFIRDNADAIITNSNVDTSENGVEVVNGGTVTISNSSIHGDINGIAVRGGTTSISESSIEADPGVSSVAIHAWGNGGTVAVDNCTIGPAETGIWMQAGVLTMPTGTVEECVWGAWADGSGQLDLGEFKASSHPRLTVRECASNGIGIDSSSPCSVEQVRVDGIGGDAGWVGVHVMPGATATITRCEVTGAQGANSVGILLEGAGTVRGPMVSSIAKTTFGTGVLIDSDSTTVITLDEAPNAGNLWDNPQIEDCYYGLAVMGYARPSVRNSLVLDNEKFCVQIGPAAVPDMGHIWDHGDNSIHGVGATQGLLAGGPIRLGGFPDVSAEGNWWGGDPPNGTKISFWVDYNPWLSSDPIPPAGANWAFEPLPQEEHWLVRPGYPMPFAERVSIMFQVTSSRDQVEVAVFDIAGRKVRTLISGETSAGEHRTEWDGRLEDGRPAPNGVYLVKVTVGRENASQKLVLAR
jgi:hypothetical protein